MYRLATVCARTPLRTAPAASRLVAAASATACPVHLRAAANATIRQLHTRTQLRQEGEERPPVSFKDARANVVKSVSADMSELEVSNDWTTSYIADNKVTVKVNAENQGVLATRTAEGHNIRITFSASDYTEPDAAEEEGAAESAEEPINEHVFFVDITNPAGKIMRVDAANAPDGELIIHSISFPTSVSPDPTTLPPRKFEDELPSTEGALDFNDLNNESQENMLDLFETLGIDDDLALFVANQSQLVRTQNLQLQLGKLKSYLQ